MIARPLLLAPLVALVASACSSRPQAPALTNESVYDDHAIGLRFLAPAGWAVHSRAVLPSGQLSKPIILISYEGGSEKPAELRVLVAELAPEGDLQQFVAEHRVGAERWTAQSPVEQISVNDAPASRFVLSRTQGKEEIRREVTAFRRAERVYFFMVDFAASDAASRDAVRTAIASVTWKK